MLSYARAAVLAGSLSTEPLVLEPVSVNVPAIRRTVPCIEPPLNLAVIPLRYSVTAERIEAVRLRCRHRQRRVSS